MSIVLSKKELYALTGYSIPTKQRAVLDAQQIPYFVRANGSICVIRAHLEEWRPPEPEYPEPPPELIPDGPLTYIDGPCVYFMVCGEFIKIGYTNNLLRRRYEVPEEYDMEGPWDVLGAIPVKTQHAERIIHSRFEDCRVERELFQRSPELLRFIKNAYQEVLH